MCVIAQNAEALFGKMRVVDAVIPGDHGVGVLGKVVLILDSIGRVGQDHGHTAIRELRKQVHAVHVVELIAEALHSNLLLYGDGSLA